MRTRQARGFTLVEMLIAIGILAMIAVLGWRGLDGMLRSRVALTDSTQQMRAMQRTFAQLQDDCAHFAGASTVEGWQSLNMTPDRFMLVRTVFAEGQPSQLQAVVYRLRDGTLIRQESMTTRDLPPLKQFLQTAANGSGNEGMPLQRGVSNMTVRAWSGNWSASPPSGVPATGLEVTLRLTAGGTAIQRLFLLGAA
jgi:general secretion pathway protein J